MRFMWDFLRLAQHNKSLRKSLLKSRIKGFRTILGEAASGLESGLNLA